MQMKFRFWLVFVVAGYATVLMSACGRQQAEPVTLTWWQFRTDRETRPLIDSLVQKFEKRYPKIKVAVTDLTWEAGHDKIAIAFGADAAPDVIEFGSDWVPEFITAGKLYDLTDSVADLKEQLLRWEPVTRNERLYGVPWTLGTRVLFYNRTLLQKAGFTGPPQSWSELLLQARTINALGSQIYGFGANANERHRLYKKFLPFLWANGGQILADDQSRSLLDEPRSVAALEFYTKLCDAGLMATQTELDDTFCAGRLGFVISGDWLLKRLTKTPPAFEFGTALLPRPRSDSGPPASFAGGEYLAVNAKTKNLSAALAFLRFLIAREINLEFCQKAGLSNPANRDAAADPYFQSDPNRKTFIEQMQFSVFPPFHPKWVYIEEAIEKAVEEAMYNKKSPRQALVDASATIDALLKSP